MRLPPILRENKTLILGTAIVFLSLISLLIILPYYTSSREVYDSYKYTLCKIDNCTLTNCKIRYVINGKTKYQETGLVESEYGFIDCWYCKDDYVVFDTSQMYKFIQSLEIFAYINLTCLLYGVVTVVKFFC